MSAEPAGRPAGEASARLGGAVDVLTVFVLCAGAVLSAVLEALLVPLRVGTVIVPLAVLIAVVGNIAFPALVWFTRRKVVLAAVPFVLWVLTILWLSQSRPEGDVLMPGGKTGLVWVSYGLLLGGFVTGLATLVVLSNATAPRTSRAAATIGRR